MNWSSETVGWNETSWSAGTYVRATARAGCPSATGTAMTDGRATAAVSATSAATARATRRKGGEAARRSAEAPGAPEAGRRSGIGRGQTRGPCGIGRATADASPDREDVTDGPWLPVQTGRVRRPDRLALRSSSVVSVVGRQRSGAVPGAAAARVPSGLRGR